MLERKRIRAFGTVHLTIGGAEHPVTRLREARSGQPPSFRTADRRVLAPDRLGDCRGGPTGSPATASADTSSGGQLSMGPPLHESVSAFVQETARASSFSV